MGTGIFVAVLVALQIFLLTVGVEGLLTYDPGLSWATAVLSTVLAAGSIGLFLLFRRH